MSRDSTYWNTNHRKSLILVQTDRGLEARETAGVGTRYDQNTWSRSLYRAMRADGRRFCAGADAMDRQ